MRNLYSMLFSRSYLIMVLPMVVLAATRWANESASNPPLAPPPRLLVAGTGAGALLVENGVVTKKYPTGGCQDAWMLKDGSVVAIGAQAFVFDPQGKVLRSYRPPAGVQLHNCQPLPGGGILLAECGTKRLLELNADMT